MENVSKADNVALQEVIVQSDGSADNEQSVALRTPVKKADEIATESKSTLRRLIMSPITIVQMWMWQSPLNAFKKMSPIRPGNSPLFFSFSAMKKLGREVESESKESQVKLDDQFIAASLESSSGWDDDMKEFLKDLQAGMDKVLKLHDYFKQGETQLNLKIRKEDAKLDFKAQRINTLIEEGIRDEQVRLKIREAELTAEKEALSKKELYLEERLMQTEILAAEYQQGSIHLVEREDALQKEIVREVERRSAEEFARLGGEFSQRAELFQQRYEGLVERERNMEQTILREVANRTADLAVKEARVHEQLIMLHETLKRAHSENDSVLNRSVESAETQVQSLERAIHLLTSRLDNVGFMDVGNRPFEQSPVKVLATIVRKTDAGVQTDNSRNEDVTTILSAVGEARATQTDESVVQSESKTLPVLEVDDEISQGTLVLAVAQRRLGNVNTAECISEETAIAVEQTLEEVRAILKDEADLMKKSLPLIDTSKVPNIEVSNEFSHRYTLNDIFDDLITIAFLLLQNPTFRAEQPWSKDFDPTKHELVLNMQDLNMLRQIPISSPEKFRSVAIHLVKRYKHYGYVWQPTGFDNKASEVSPERSEEIVKFVDLYTTAQGMSTYKQYVDEGYAVLHRQYPYSMEFRGRYQEFTNPV